MKIEHIALYVQDLEGAKAFFCQYFDAAANTLYHNPRTGFRSYFLAFSDGARLELMQKPQLPGAVSSQEHLGYIHLAFSLGSQEAVNVLTARLKADGYPVISGPRTTGDGYYESCIAGFEGNLIELTV